eukprot:3288537-Rhodomonas_salina.1
MVVRWTSTDEAYGATATRVSSPINLAPGMKAMAGGFAVESEARAQVLVLLSYAMSGMVLCARYAMSGMVLRGHYAMSGVALRTCYMRWTASHVR